MKVGDKVRFNLTLKEGTIKALDLTVLTPAPETPYAYHYIVDVDGVTLVEFYEVKHDVYRMCNLAGEPCARYARIEGAAC